MEYALQVLKENNFPPRSYAHQISPVSREQISSDRPWLEVLTPWGSFLSKLFRFSWLDILFLTVCLVHFSILISTCISSQHLCLPSPTPSSLWALHPRPPLLHRTLSNSSLTQTSPLSEIYSSHQISFSQTLGQFHYISVAMMLWSCSWNLQKGN